MCNNAEVCDYYAEGLCACGAASQDGYIGIKSYDDQGHIIYKCPHDDLEGQMSCQCFEIEE